MAPEPVHADEQEEGLSMTPLGNGQAWHVVTEYWRFHGMEDSLGLGLNDLLDIILVQ